MFPPFGLQREVFGLTPQSARANSVTDQKHYDNGTNCRVFSASFVTKGIIGDMLLNTIRDLQRIQRNSFWLNYVFITLYQQNAEPNGLPSRIFFRESWERKCVFYDEPQQEKNKYRQIYEDGV